MASAILTSLYPDDFTFYNIRVCDQQKNFQHLKGITDFDILWQGYTQFKSSVIEMSPNGLSLLDKNRKQLKDYSDFIMENFTIPTCTEHEKKDMLIIDGLKREGS